MNESFSATNEEIQRMAFLSSLALTGLAVSLLLGVGIPDIFNTFEEYDLWTTDPERLSAMKDPIMEISPYVPSEQELIDAKNNAIMRAVGFSVGGTVAAGGAAYFFSGKK